MGNSHSNHSHSHGHSHAIDPDSKNLGIAFFMNFIFALLEFAGGYWTNSVAITADAIHDLGDSLALLTAWVLQKVSKRGSDNRYNFGYRRFSILGAMITGLLLVLGSVFVVREAWERIQSPEPVYAPGMLLFALLGVAVNGYAAYRLSKGEGLNQRMVFWHMMEDLLGWVAVLIVSVVLMFQPSWTFLDPLLSFGVAALILWNALRSLKSVLKIFLQSRPDHLDDELMEPVFRGLDQVKGWHALRAWSLDGESHVMALHVVMGEDLRLSELTPLRKELKHRLKHLEFQYSHIEFEFEAEDCADE